MKKSKSRIDRTDLGHFEIHELDDGTLDNVTGASTNIFACKNPQDCSDTENWLGCANMDVCLIEG